MCQDQAGEAADCCDVPRFGRSPTRSVPVTYAREGAALLDRLRIEQAAMIGAR